MLTVNEMKCVSNVGSERRKTWCLATALNIILNLEERFNGSASWILPNAVDREIVTNSSQSSSLRQGIEMNTLLICPGVLC